MIKNDFDENTIKIKKITNNRAQKSSDTGRRVCTVVVCWFAKVINVRTSLIFDLFRLKNIRCILYSRNFHFLAIRIRVYCI